MLSSRALRAVVIARGRVKFAVSGRWQMLSDEERMNAEQDFFGDGA